MPLDATHANTAETPFRLSKTGVITEAFANIGTTADTMMPRPRKARDRVAEELWRAQLLSGLAEQRKNDAKRAAIAAGVLPDYTTEPFPVGTAETVYAGPAVTIGLKVVNQGDRVDVPGLVADLEKSGIKPTVLKRLVKKHTRSFGGAHIFTASLVSP
jgi:hypothetical protein